MALTDEDWRLAEALAVQSSFGDEAPMHVAARIGELVLLGDQAGVARWKKIAAQLDRLIRPTMQ